jgi:hypothetical protein
LKRVAPRLRLRSPLASAEHPRDMA